MVTAVLLSVASAAAYAFAAVGQERVAAGAAAGWTAALRRPRWWRAMALNALGGGLHVLALRHGSLAVVQPLGALTLVFALPIGAALGARRVTGREWRGAALTMVGLTALLLAAATTAPATALDDAEVVGLAAATALVVAGLLAPRRPPRTRATGLRYATASGLTFGVSSVLTQTVTLRFVDIGIDLTTLAIAAAVAVLAVSGVLLSQAAYRSGLGAQLATLTIVNPVACVAVGAVLLDQRLGPAATAVAVVSGALAAYGVVLLAGTHHRRFFAHAHRRPGTPAGRP